MNNAITHDPISRRTFLKLAAGTAAGAMLFKFPFTASAKEAAAAMEIRPIALADLPKTGEAAAKAAPLIKSSYADILKIVDTIKDSSLRSAVLAMIKNPFPTFMENYTSSSSIQRLYNQLLDQKLIDPSKISAETLLPPVPTKLQPFMTAPGSGYMSHHSYPGGLSTHVDSNLHITVGICETYKDVFHYDVDYDTAVAAQALHDIEKPFVFQWQEDGSSRKEYTIAGQGAHHVLSIAESIYRGMPAEEIVAQACAHAAPTSKKEEADVVSWIRAASIIIGKDPVRLGLLTSDGEGLPAPHKQEGYIVHLGDHDWGPLRTGCSEIHRHPEVHLPERLWLHGTRSEWRSLQCLQKLHRRTGVLPLHQSPLLPPGCRKPAEKPLPSGGSEIAASDE